MRAVPRVLAITTAIAVVSAGNPTSRADGTTSRTLEPGTLKVCLYAGFAPVSSKDPGGHFIGSDVDYLRAFAQSQRLAFQPVEMTDYIGIWEKPARGVCDIAAAGISDTPDRRAAAGRDSFWSQHYYSVLRAFLVRPSEADDLTGIDDLRGKTVIVTADSTADHDLRNRLARAGITSTTIIGTTDEADAARLVRDAGQSAQPFAYAGGLVSVQFLASALGGLAVAWPHCNMLSDGTEVEESFSFVVRALDAGLPEALDTFIATNPYPAASEPAHPSNDDSCFEADRPG